MSQITLKDIARELGVTATTVHRALHGKEGVGEVTRKKIQQKAAQMGYRTNYMAAALKRKEIRIAVVLPEAEGDNRFYYGNMWAGVHQFLQEIGQDFNVVSIERFYSLAQPANGAVLKALYDEHAKEIDGLLTMGVHDKQSFYYIRKFSEREVPVVFVGSDMKNSSRFCCVKNCDEMAGSLAAELLSTFNFNKTPQKVVAIGHFHQWGINDQQDNVKGFDFFIKEHAPYMDVVHIHHERDQAACEELRQQLKNDLSISAIYSSSARYTVYVAQVLEEMGLAGKLTFIGNDCFEESLHLLQRGVLTAIIDKRIAYQSYLGIKVLFDHVVKDDYPSSSLLQMRPQIVLRSNLKKDFPGAVPYDFSEPAAFL